MILDMANHGGGTFDMIFRSNSSGMQDNGQGDNVGCGGLKSPGILCVCGGVWVLMVLHYGQTMPHLRQGLCSDTLIRYKYLFQNCILQDPGLDFGGAYFGGFGDNFSEMFN